MKKITISTICFALSVFFTASPVLAHVVVRPSQVGVAERVNFAVSVPTEEDIPTVGLRLVLPDGLQSVRPNVKPGWNIQLVKSGEGEDARITEIVWTGGSIPAEQRDEFVFSSQAPAEETSLVWKAYQTYEDGDIVSWDTDPEEVEAYEKNHPVAEGEHDENAPNPFSVTKVVNDLKEQTVATNPSVQNATKNSSLLTAGVLVALFLSGASIWMQMKKKK